MSLTPDMMPAWELKEHLEDRDASIGILGNEVSRLTAERDEQVNWVRDLADSLIAEEAKTTRLTAEVERLRAALEWFVKCENSIMTDVLSAHRNRGNGASQWMMEDDADFRRDLRQAFETARAALKEPRT